MGFSPVLAWGIVPDYTLRRCPMESALMPTTEGAILERIIEPEKAHLAPDVARYLLTLDFSSADRERMQQLAEKAQADTLTPAEKQDSENYQRVGQLLARMKDRARQV